MLHKIFMNIGEKMVKHSDIFYEAGITLISKSNKHSIRKENFRLNPPSMSMQKFESTC